MKKLIFSAFCITVAIFSCSKKATTPDFPLGISATIDGVDQTFSYVGDSVDYYNTSTGSILGIGARNGPTLGDDDMVISFEIDGKIVPGNYVCNINLPNQIYFFYGIKGGSKKGNAYNVDPYAQSQITITSLTSTNVQGTFSGTLLCDTAQVNTPTKIVTNGKFNFKLR